MTDEQIIKAVEIAKGALSDGDIDMETFTALNNAINFINRQKAENEELRSDKIIAERHEKDARDLFVDCTRQLEEATAEIERLKKRNTLLLKNKCKDINTARKIIKSEAIKEFAERLKSKLDNLEFRTKTYRKTVPTKFCEDNVNWVLHECVPRDIDNLVKEMTEESE